MVLLSFLSNTPGVRVQKTGQEPPNKGRKFPGEPLTADEMRLILRACSRRAPTGIRNKALLTTMYRTGLRVSEALALRPADVDPGAGTVRVLAGKGRKARTVGIDDGALEVVQRWLDKRRELGIRGRTLFCTLDGGELRDTYVRDMLKRAGARAGIVKRLHPHGLRHSYASDLVREGVPLNVISKSLGHSSSAITSRYLDHIAPADVIAVGRSRSWPAGEQ
jgi:site-specific recombinase XerD